MGGNDRLDELIALDAVGALTAEEARELDELLARYPNAGDEHRELGDAATLIADSVGEPPPPHLRAAVLAAIADREESVAPVVKLHHRRWMIPATAVAAAALLIVGGLVIQDIADAPSDDERVAEVVSDPQATTVMLTGTIGQLELYKSSAHDMTVLMGRDIEAPSGDFVFQLWAIVDDEMRDMGTFVPDPEGGVEMMMDGVSPPDTRYAVTVEPVGGSEQPTGAHVADSV
jgi:anti-sigma-K factor RskA